MARLLAVALLAGPAAAACSAPPNAPSFTAMPLPQANLATVLGPVTGTGPATITLTARYVLSYTLGCLGHHVVWLRTTPKIASFAVQCGDGGVFAGESGTVPGREATAEVSLRIAAPSGTIWELRVDGSPR
jgi:hypothetical protein